jgi:hypothetical protein
MLNYVSLPPGLTVSLEQMLIAKIWFAPRALILSTNANRSIIVYASA